MILAALLFVMAIAAVKWLDAVATRAFDREIRAIIKDWNQ